MYCSVLDVLAKTYGTITPMHQVAYERSKVVFYCHSHRLALWRKDGNRLINSRRISLYRNKLILRKVNEKNNGNYTCLGTGQNGSKYFHFQTSAELLVGGMCKIGIYVIYWPVRISAKLCERNPVQFGDQIFFFSPK